MCKCDLVDCKANKRSLDHVTTYFDRLITTVMLSMANLCNLMNNNTNRCNLMMYDM